MAEDADALQESLSQVKPSRKYICMRAMITLHAGLPV
jgi:hypothetical protein